MLFQHQSTDLYLYLYICCVDGWGRDFWKLNMWPWLSADRDEAQCCPPICFKVGQVQSRDCKERSLKKEIKIRWIFSLFLIFLFQHWIEMAVCENPSRSSVSACLAPTNMPWSSPSGAHQQVVFTWAYMPKWVELLPCSHGWNQHVI